MDFFVRTHGQDALVKLIHSYADGLTDDEAFTAAIGVDRTAASRPAGWPTSGRRRRSSRVRSRRRPGRCRRAGHRRACRRDPNASAFPVASAPADQPGRVVLG